MGEIRLSDLQSVHELKGRIGVFNRPSAFRVRFEFATNMSKEAQHFHQKWIAFCLADCGCGLASLMLVATLLISYWLGYLQFSPHWQQVVPSVAFAVLLALLGKLTSLWLTHRFTHRLLDSVLSTAQRTQPPIEYTKNTVD